MAQNQAARTLSPFCYICSTEKQPNVRHEHMSSREIRIIQGVDKTSRPYMCITCSCVHSARLTGVLNILVGTDQFFNIHTPTETGAARKDPDPFHIEWISVRKATVAELEQAWVCDYLTTRTPMRIFLSAGLEDLAQGKSVTDLIESFLHFKQTVDHQNSKNELVIATMLNPPSLVWFKDNGGQPRNHKNLLTEIMEANSWIIKFNEQNGKLYTPRFHRFGVRDGWSIDADGKRNRVKRHNFSQWSDKDPVRSRFLLSGQTRVSLGNAVVRHFKSEMDRSGHVSPAGDN